jgi:hypothetical protein
MITARHTSLAAGIAAALVLLGGTVVSAAPWEPTENDTCSTELHDSYQVRGQDGELYDSWHPASVTDPETGETCTFGHEHGDDPRTSDIWDWTVEKLGDEATGVPFGFASARTHMMEGAPHRHEDHVGHKVLVQNDVKLVREDRGGYATDASGEPITCDYLVYAHQGSHSGDALKNNQHELLYSTRCTDGTEMVLSFVTGFGNANEYTASCDGRTVTTGGSDLEDGQAGSREIPDVTCVQEHAPDFWATYELWKADQTITSPDGGDLVRVDPWFGVRNPSRVGAGAEPRATVDVFDEQPQSWPWNLITQGMTQHDPDSPFDGSERDFYVQHSTVDNVGGATEFYTDPYGNDASYEAGEASIRQYVSATSNTDLPELERRAFGFSTDYGADGDVHAPN